MRGTITIMAGRYDLAPYVWFEVSQSDAGTRILLHDDRINAEYFVEVGELGKATEGGVQPIHGKPPKNYVPPVVTENHWVEEIRPGQKLNLRMKEAAFDPLRPIPAFAKHRFTLWHPPAARDRNWVRPMAGYEGDGGTYIFYRRGSQHRGERLLKVLDENQAVLEDDTDASRLPREEWVRFFHMLPRQRFMLDGQQWHKMTVQDVAATVSGKVFRCCAEESEE